MTLIKSLDISYYPSIPLNENEELAINNETLYGNNYINDIFIEGKKACILNVWEEK